MHNLWLDFLIILCIILINSFFVLAEIAIITSGRPRLSIIAQSGNRGAQAALSLMQKPENFLSAVQIGITSMSILIGLYGGESMVTEHVESLIKDLPIIGLYSWSLSYAIVVIVITYLAVVAEIIPKRIAMIYPERIASIVSRVMLLITALAHPFVYVLSISVKGFLWIFNIKSIDTSTSMEEVKFVLQQAESSGTLQNIEKDILRRAIYIGDVEVCAIMTPRKQMICINIKDKEAVNIHKLENNAVWDLVVIDGDIEKAVGIISIKDLFNKKISNSLINQLAKKRKILYVPEFSKISKLIELFKQKRSNVAIVTNEYGEVEGVVTLEDIMQRVVGDVARLNKKPEIIKKGDNAFIVEGNVLIEEVKEILKINSLPDEEESEYRTLASFVLKQCKGLPKKDDSFICQGWSFKVINVEKFRVVSVYISKSN